MTEEARALGSRICAQVAIVVRDIDVMAQRWADVLGVPVPGIMTTHPGLERAQTFRDEPSDARAKLAFFDLGAVQLELIEPIGEGKSSWHEALEKKGEGPHHIAFWVEGMPQSAAFLKEQGISLMHRGDMGDGQFAYFDSAEKLGITLELLERVRTEGRVEG